MNTLRLVCRRMRWKQWICFFSILVITGLLPLSSIAETVPMENVWVTAHTAYKVSVSAGSQGCQLMTVDTGEFPSKAEVLAALLPLKLDLSGCNSAGLTMYYYFNTDSNPDYYQVWSFTVSGNHTHNTLGGTWLIQTINYPPTYKMQCPIPKIRPNVPYTPDSNGLTCSRQDTLTITLDGGTEVEPSNGSDKKTLPIIATVKDQNNQPPTSPVQVHVSLKVEDPKSGGHDHGESTRPRGGIDNVRRCTSDSECWSKQTDGNGKVEFDFKAPDASGKYIISATCDGNEMSCSNVATKPVDVKVDGLATIPSSTFYTFIGQTAKHSDNHYLTPEAGAILWRIAVSYQIEQQFKLRHPVTRRYTVTPPVLYVNDASLEWGGKFDLSGRWTGPHFEHRRGTVVDLRANGLDTAIPDQNFDEFMLLVSSYGADALLEEPDINTRHFHIRLLNRRE